MKHRGEEEKIGPASLTVVPSGKSDHNVALKKFREQLRIS